MYKLDFTLTSAQERIKHIQDLLKTVPGNHWSPAQLTYFADYILNNQQDKAARKARSKGIITPNRRATLEKRELSFEGYIDLCSDQNKDEIYNHIINDKNALLSPKLQITQRDVAEIPGMATLKDAIAATKEKLENPDSPNRGKLLMQLIQLRKDQYVLKEAYRKPIRFQKMTKSFHTVHIEQNVEVTYDDNIVLVSGFSFCDERCAAVVCQNYARLRDLTQNEITTDGYYILREFEDLVDKYVKSEWPQLFDILILKIDGLLGKKIAEILNDKYGVSTFTDASISKLWRQKLPKVIAAGAQEEYLSHYYLQEVRGRYRQCGRCKQIKLASPRYFQRNNHNSADGFYSICKECKNKKRQPLKAREGWNGAYGL